MSQVIGVVLVQHRFVALWLTVLHVTCKEGLVAAIENVYLRIFEFRVDVHSSVVVAQEPHAGKIYTGLFCAEKKATLQHVNLKN